MSKLNIKQNKLPIIIGSLALVTLMAIIYAVFTGTLNISGTANVRDSKWDIHIVESGQLEPSDITESARVLTKPTASTLSISDFNLSLTTPGDYIEYTFHVVNDGDYDATLSDLDKAGVTCTVNGSTSDPEAVKVCEKLEYTLKYDNGSTVTEGDTLLSKETKTMILTIKYQEFDDPSLLPTTNVSISGLGIDISYSQSGNAKVNEDGTTPYDPYSHHVGDRIQVAGETYRVIANSPVSDDYVVALKENLLTKNEIIAAGGDAGGVANNYGIMAYYNGKYGSTSDYAFLVKSVVDNWATSKFNNSEIKEVNGYSARLITISELENLGYVYDSSAQMYNLTDNVPSWTHDDSYSYWTMSAVDSKQVWDVRPKCVVSIEGINYNVSGVRPVINVYKSAITQ